jgi:hypothetical protein
MKTQRQINAWKIRFSASFLTVLIMGIIIKDIKFALLICKGNYNLQLAIVVIILLSVTAIVFLGRFGVFSFTEKLFRHIHYAEWVLRLLVIASTLVGFDGKLIDFHNLILLDIITLIFNIIAVWLYPTCCDIIIDSLKYNNKPASPRVKRGTR